MAIRTEVEFTTVNDHNLIQSVWPVNLLIAHMRIYIIGTYNRNFTNRFYFSFSFSNVFNIKIYNLHNLFDIT